MCECASALHKPIVLVRDVGEQHGCVQIFNRLRQRRIERDIFHRLKRKHNAVILGDHGKFVAQEGTPYAAQISPFLSPLGVPCQAPPYGLLNAIDLTTGKMVWERPLGTARDLGPDLSGKRQPIRSHLPFVIGTPNFGGTLNTASGLVFAGASSDRAFRAFDGETGKLLFEATLPGNGTASPMSFKGRDGRQYVAIMSEAPPRDGKVYGAVTAFAVP